MERGRVPEKLNSKPSGHSGLGSTPQVLDLSIQGAVPALASSPHLFSQQAAWLAALEE